MKLLASIAVVAALLSPAFAQPVQDDQRILRPPLTQSDLDAASRRLTRFELTDTILQRVLEDVRKNPEKLKDYVDDPAKLKKFLPQDTPPEAVQDLAKKLQPSPEPNTARPLPFDPTRPAPTPRVDRRSEPRAPPLDPRWNRNKSVKTFMKFWEKNVGSLDRTPELKKTMIELLNSSIESDGSSPLESPAFDSLLDPEKDFGKEFASLLESAADGANWKWTGFDDWRPKLPSAELPTPGTGYTPPTYDESTELPAGKILLAVAAIVLAVIFVRHGGLESLLSRSAKSPESVRIITDPSAVKDRATLVLAFEGIALKTLGETAEVWSHTTIAAEFAKQVPVTLADDAARYYEWARYAPPDEPAPADAIAEARHSLARLNEAMAR